MSSFRVMRFAALVCFAMCSYVTSDNLYESMSYASRYDRKMFRDGQVPDGGYSKLIHDASLSICASECHAIKCSAFFYTDDERKTCQIHSDLINVTFKQSPKTVMFRKETFVPGIRAWQTSTFLNSQSTLLSAEFAIDGNLDNTDVNGRVGRCAMTNSYNSFWAMEFARVAEVEFVQVYFRNPYGSGSNNLRFLISKTRQDSDNNIGTECANYTGPPVRPEKPVKIMCHKPVRGRFLKIIQHYSSYLTLCEVQIYST